MKSPSSDDQTYQENPDEYIRFPGSSDLVALRVSGSGADSGRDSENCADVERAEVRRVSMSLRHSEVEFSEYLRLSFGVC